MPEVGLTIPQRPKCKAATLGSNMLKTRRVPLADKLQTYRDLQKTKRSLDLLREQYDKDHGCRDGNIQYYPCEDDDTWDFLDNLEEDIL